jgi:hypothetical protein
MKVLRYHALWWESISLIVHGPNYQTEESSKCGNWYVADEIGNVWKFDFFIALCDGCKQFVECSCKEKALSIFMFDAIHEKSGKFDDVEAIFL